MNYYNKTIADLLNKFTKLNSSILPSPIYKLNKLSNYLSKNIYCLRDDLTGFALGGNKTRKLDYLIADAIQKKADTLIAIGANQSNFCRMAAGYGKQNGLEVHLVLAGEKPSKITGNLLLDYLFETNIYHIDTENYEYVYQKAKELELKLNKKGKNVYFLPMGGSTPIGILGYVKAFDEIMTYSEKQNISFSNIIFASGSGGTQAGLVIGKALSSWTGEIIGISAGKATDKLFNVVTNMCSETIKEFGLKVNTIDVKIDDAYLGVKYGARTKEATEAIKIFAQLEGLILDEVYTGKAAAGLIDYARKSKFNLIDNILFIHTGGFVQLFE